MARPIGRFHEGGQSHGMGTARREGDRPWLRRPERPRHDGGLHREHRHDGRRELAQRVAQRQFLHRQGPEHQSVGQSLGVAIVGSVAATGLAGGIASSHFAASTHVGWWLLTGCGVLVFVLGVITTTAWARSTATRTAEALGFGDERAGAASARFT